MYHEFYNFAAMPFENTPDPRFFFASEQHREALASIEYTLRMRKGFVMVTGAIGSGKTTIATAMRQRCGQAANVISLLHGHRTPEELLRQTLRALQVRHGKNDDHARLLERLGQYLQAEANTTRPLVLFVDEAQTLSDEALEELRLLSNFDTATHKPVQVILCGQPELRRRVCSPRFDALRQRIVLAKQLAPLGMSDIGPYIRHRIATASNDPANPGVSFSEEAIAQVYKLSNGVPRLINVICDNCLLLGFVREARTIEAAMVQLVAQDMMPTFALDSSDVIQTKRSGPGLTPVPMPSRLSLTGTM